MQKYRLFIDQFSTWSGVSLWTLFLTQINILCSRLMKLYRPKN